MIRLSPAVVHITHNIIDAVNVLDRDHALCLILWFYFVRLDRIVIAIMLSRLMPFQAVIGKIYRGLFPRGGMNPQRY